MILLGKIALGRKSMASNYEKTVEKLLMGKVHYKKEVTFPTLHGAKSVPLRFDFGVYYNNGKLKCLIEVDGEYHFHPIRGKLALQRQQAYDKKKNNYCLINNIKLIRIPYWEINNLTYEKIFNTSNFVVKDKLHNYMLVPPR